MPEENKQPTPAQREEEILAFWEREHIFEKSLEKPSPEGEFVFYDGPPFATGLPHYGSLLSSIIKDVVPRYKTMRGYHVRRRWGWDCHGLPIESMVEKKLGLKSKKDIEAIGVETFNNACAAEVLRYTHEWGAFVRRIGRWVEFENAYKTMDPTYIESVWWALKQAHEQGKLYEGRKVLLYCPHCETPLAKAEIAMDNSYKDVTEETVTAKFKVKIEGQTKGLNLPPNINTFLLAWTTTPWTLPGNVALAVNRQLKYGVYVKGDEAYILAVERAESYGLKDPYETWFGSELRGMEYEPLYEITLVKDNKGKKWEVLNASFVSAEEGTGIVHTAVIYGEDDYQLGIAEGLPMVPLLDSSGHFNQHAPELIRGQYFKKAEKAIKADLEARGLLFAKSMYTHSYPHCFRCETPLYYNAISSWFLNIQEVKQRMIALNEDINWVPEYLKHGRFGHIVEDAPDWTISRNRFWASPLPIWKCEKCQSLKVVGSLDELREGLRKSTNTYIVMRHGEAESNVQKVLNSDPAKENHLTGAGKAAVERAGQELSSKKIDLIVTSPFMRTQETAALVADAIGLSGDNIVVDDRLHEFNGGIFDGKPSAELHAYYTSEKEWLYKAPSEGENMSDVRARVGELLYELDEKYQDKIILIVTHDAPAWMLAAAAEGVDRDSAIHIGPETGDFLEPGQWREYHLKRVPHNKYYELDLHRPYVDVAEFSCSCGGVMQRISEVVDCWVESGSMPFAELHYPFENKELFEQRFPGDFIAEYIAQTRTWFYYMHAMAVLMFDNISFRNVVTTGTILAADGSKMSKSKGNYTDPMQNIDRYGADALRYYLMTSVVMQAEDVRFSDDELKETHNRVMNILRNSFRFYEMYSTEENISASAESTNVLDQWILTLLKKLVQEVTENLDAYNTVKTGRAIRQFVTDLSTWYIRRSRDRFKDTNDAEDQKNALATTRFVFLEFSKIIAPLMSFIAEEIYQKVKDVSDPESVHLAEWPSTPQLSVDEEDLIAQMQAVRGIVAEALRQRAEHGIKVRQPLAELTIHQKISEIYNELIQDEVNVKKVVHDYQSGMELAVIDPNITPELKEEGWVRELVRNLQELRKTLGLTPQDVVMWQFSAAADTQAKIERWKEGILRDTRAKGIVFGSGDGGQEIVVEGEKIIIKAN